MCVCVCASVLFWGRCIQSVNYKEGGVAMGEEKQSTGFGFEASEVPELERKEFITQVSKQAYNIVWFADLDKYLSVLQNPPFWFPPLVLCSRMFCREDSRMETSVLRMRMQENFFIRSAPRETDVLVLVWARKLD